jgi:hypothetical protein
MPFSVDAEVLVRDAEAGGWGRHRVSGEFHSCFCWRPPCFATVARKATTDHVFPAMLATSTTWDNVVQSQLLGFSSTILASMPVPVEYFETSELSLEAGTPDRVGKADYRGDGKRAANSMYRAQTIFYYLGLASEHQDQCSSNSADIYRLVVLVQNENRNIYGLHGLSR